MLTEDELTRFRAGESDAVRAVYREYGRLVFAVCRNQLGSQQLAEEAAQQTFLKAWRSASTVEPGRDLAPWLATIARRTAIDVHRQESREKSSNLDDVPVAHPALVQAGVAIEGVERHNRSDDRIRLSLLAVDTHGYSNGAMALAKLLGFDLCPRLRDLAERKLYMPPGFPVPEGIERATVKRLSRKAICSGWDDLMRVVASIRIGKIGADVALRLLGSAAQGDPAYKAADHLGRLLRSIFLCDYVAIPDFRRETQILGAG